MCFDEWTQVPNPRITVISRKVSPPLDNESSESRIISWGADFPKDLAEFYCTAANGCDVNIMISRELDFRYRTRKEIAIPRTIVCGFAIAAFGELERIRKHLSDTIKVIEKFWKIPEHLTEFLRFAFPFWMTRGGDYLVIATGGKMKEAVFFLRKESLLEADFALKYADSFDEWLSFLEQNCYVGPEWSEMCAWHNGTKLESNPDFTEQILEYLR